MQIVKILLLSLTLVACSNTNEIRQEQSFPNVEIERYKYNNGYSYLTLHARDMVSGDYQPAAFLINDIWFQHYKKAPLTVTVSEGSFDLRIMSVSKLPFIIEDLKISKGDSVVLNITMQDDTSPLIDRSE